MSRRQRLLSAHWVVGAALALSGASFVRFVATGLDRPHRLIATASGEMLALLGLFVIALGVRRRLVRAAAGERSPVSS